MSSRNDEHDSSIPKVTEDGPVMRSVAIMSPQSMAPLDSFQRLSLKSDKAFLHQNNEVGKIAIALSSNQMVKPDADSFPWRVVKALPLPCSYQLDRSHVKISGVPALEISKRIADYFCQQSISAVFDNEKSLAVATNARCLKFHVRIWEASDEIIVEVQKYAGCGIDFQCTVKEILSVAKSGKVVTSRIWSLPMPQCLPKLPDNIWEESTNEALDIACENFKNSNRVDSHSLAIESLEHLSCSQHCRIFCAKAILSPESELLPIIVSLIHQTGLTSRQISEDTAVGLDDCYHLMHRGAVNTLSNCLESLTEAMQSSKGLIDCLLSLADEKTLSAMVHDIARAESNPHDAAASVRCVKLLCQCNDNIKQRVLKLGVTGHISNAANCRHSVLQQESNLLLKLL